MEKSAIRWVGWGGVQTPYGKVMNYFHIFWNSFLIVMQVMHLILSHLDKSICCHTIELFTILETL